MDTKLYRYEFDDDAHAEDIEATLLLAAWGCEALHGEAQTRLDAAHAFEADRRTCVIDAGTDVGRSLNRLFLGYARREFGEDAFVVSRVETAVPQLATSE